MVSIAERIKKQRGVTRYCNCDSSTCTHIPYGSKLDSVCSNDAVVVATVDDINGIQLCGECLQHAKSAVSA
jgi:hypothetical protein